jgi:hypothetical protein
VSTTKGSGLTPLSQRPVRGAAGAADAATNEGDSMPSNSGGRRRTVYGSPWQGIVDACEAAAQRFADPVAMEGVNALDTAADAIEALAKSFTTVGHNVLDTVHIDPRVASYFEELGRYVQAAAQPTRDGAAAVRSAHADDIEKIEENDPKKRRWDISAHDGGPSRGRSRRL